MTILLWYNNLIRYYTLLIRQSITILNYYRHSNLICYHTHNDTANYNVTILQLIQKLQCYYIPLDTQSITYYTHTDTAIYYVTILLWYNNLIRYYTLLIRQSITILKFIDTATYYITILPLIQQSNTLLYSYLYNIVIRYYTHWDSNLIHYYTSIDTAI